ncbi:MAG: hydrolase [Legionellaceae bacterium]|nr:hydrolase [Legionellaceae bacterium]
MIIESSFKPAWWLKNAHIQTIYSSISRKQKAQIDSTERLELPDGDFIDLAWAQNGLSDDAPLVVFLHGLGGSVESSYVAGQIAAYNKNGWRAVLMHFRGASHEPNRLPRAYHSGDTADLNYFLEILSLREPNTQKAVVGISIGGNVLLKWLGETGAQKLVSGGVAVSVPFVLNSVADKINKGFSKIYQIYLLKRMRAIFFQKNEKYPEMLNEYMDALKSSECFWTFDDKVTAPLYGFAGVHDYYKQSSSRYYLQKIATPTLIIHALDDPFMHKDVIPEADELSKDVTLELSKKGGHVGFVSGKFPGQATYWLDERIPEYLNSIFSN